MFWTRSLWTVVALWSLQLINPVAYVNADMDSASPEANRYELYYSDIFPLTSAVTGPPKWHRRGFVTVNSETGASTFHPVDAEPASANPTTSLNTILEERGVTWQPKGPPYDATMASTTQEPRYGVVLVEGSSSTPSRVLLALNPACTLKKTVDPEQEHWTLHLDHTGQIFHFDYSAGDAQRCASGGLAEITSLAQLPMQIQVSVSTPTAGPTPQLNRRTVPDPSDPTGEKKQEESKSFIVKY
ncbi:hypothetical protein IWQ61_007363, partial [Dispira simplex]